MADRTPGTARAQYTVLAVLLASSFALFWFNLKLGINLWNATHWLFTYDTGFAKRALVGTVYLGLTGEAQSLALYTLHLQIAAAVTLAFTLVVYASVGARPAAAGYPVGLRSWALGLLLLSAPGTVPQLAFDLGRFDAIGLLILCLAFVVASRLPPLIAFTALAVLSATSILIHEAYVFWIVPTGFALWLWRNGLTWPTVTAAVTAAATFLLMALWVGRFVYGDRMTFEEAEAMLAAEADFPVIRNSLLVHFRSISENLTYTAGYAWTEHRLPALALGGAVLAAYVALVLSLFASSGHLRTLRAWLLLASCFGPLVLMVVGHDQGRWFAMVNCSL
ncbi:MAG: hypothetical protein AAFX00_00920, partial [Pseudomonadota bacterium]